jgi:hypothetical protein
VENFNHQLLSAKVAEASLAVVPIVSRGKPFLFYFFPLNPIKTNTKAGDKWNQSPSILQNASDHSRYQVFTGNVIETEKVLAISAPEQWKNIFKLNLWNYRREETGCYKF